MTSRAAADVGHAGGRGSAQPSLDLGQRGEPVPGEQAKVAGPVHVGLGLAHVRPVGRPGYAVAAAVGLRESGELAGRGGELAGQLGQVSELVRGIRRSRSWL